MGERAGQERKLAAFEAGEGGVTNEGMLGVAGEEIEHDALGAFVVCGAEFAEGKHDLELNVGAGILREGDEFLGEGVVAIDDGFGDAGGGGADFGLGSSK